MSTTKQKSAPPFTSRHDWPAFWFVRLDEARREDNTEASDEAIRELRRLGYEVAFTAPAAGRSQSC